MLQARWCVGGVDSQDERAQNDHEEETLVHFWQQIWMSSLTNADIDLGSSREIAEKGHSPGPLCQDEEQRINLLVLTLVDFDCGGIAEITRPSRGYFLHTAI